MADVRMAGNNVLHEPVTARGDSRGESLKSLNENAELHSNWYDTINNWFGKGLDDIDYSARKLDDQGRVEVTKYDIAMGRSQPELQLHYELDRRRNINLSPAGQDHFQLYGKQALSTNLLDEVNGRNAQTNEGDLVISNRTENTRRTETKKGLDKLSSIEVNAEGAPEKARLLAQLRSNPKLSVAQINDAIAKVTKFNPDTITSRASAVANLENTKQSTLSQQNRDALALRNELNSTAIQMAEIKYKNDTNEYNWRTANADRDYKWNSDEADRELKAGLAELGYGDKRDERRLAREDRRAENRQLMILQLMKGLGNLGGAMAL